MPKRNRPPDSTKEDGSISKKMRRIDDGESMRAIGEYLKSDSLSRLPFEGTSYQDAAGNDVNYSLLEYASAFQKREVVDGVDFYKDDAAEKLARNYVHAHYEYPGRKEEKQNVRAIDGIRKVLPIVDRIATDIVAFRQARDRELSPVRDKDESRASRGVQSDDEIGEVKKLLRTVRAGDPNNPSYLESLQQVKMLADDTERFERVRAQIKANEKSKLGDFLDNVEAAKSSAGKVVEILQEVKELRKTRDYSKNVTYQGHRSTMRTAVKDSSGIGELRKMFIEELIGKKNDAIIQKFWTQEKAFAEKKAPPLENGR